MIPRMLPIPDETRYALRDKDAWAAAAIAALHRRENEQDLGSWSCQCRCCQWAIDTYLRVESRNAHSAADR